ncbi:hypothetical protein BFP72_03210 [Reichenbachiella sp. 5M10]|uniref:hypothetical protein n=1 Tax=Reichenbachiella sp. 5M10 TaxID=1889772 RepID=UPI000C1507D5|nr:hypothetical protein [Reichenbachiella sp. 5M10]PIB34490.1 hypothetical protein BFP72_03210 [Reichenbachiella sp. 5M10]
MIQKLDKVQKERIKRLEPALKQAAKRGDLQTAKSIIVDLQSIYLPKGHDAKLMMAKNRLFESAMEAGKLDFAERGLIGVRQRVNNRTRVYLEASSLLAICYLRQSDLVKAEPIIQEVLSNDQVIKSQPKREEFRKQIITRFDQEGALFAIKENFAQKLDPKEIQDEAGILIASSKSEEDLFEDIGKEVPEHAINILLRIDEFSKNLLPSAERLKLPPPKQAIQTKQVGKTIFSSVKRVLYKSLCDKESDIYQAWYKQGMGAILNKYSIGIAVSEAFINLGIGVKALAVPVIALIMKFGIEIYCDQYAPTDIMGMR